MQVTQWRHGDDWIQGTFPTVIVGGVPVPGAGLDALIAPSQFNHPCIVPQPHITSTSAGNASDVLAALGTGYPSGLSSPSTNGGSSWYGKAPFAITINPLDYLQFTVTGKQQLLIRLVGVLPAGYVTSGSGFVSGEIRNGCIANIYYDGNLLTQVDTSPTSNSTIKTVAVSLDGGTHTFKIEHSGGYGPNISPIGPITPLIGTSVSSNLSPTATYHAKSYQATWRIVATGTTTYDLYRTLPGASETKINVSALNTGTSYTTVNSVALGHTLLVGTGTTLTNADQASYTTDQITLAIIDITTGVGSGTSDGKWSSQVIDSGTPDTQWFAAQWDANSDLGSVSISTGNTPTPDSSWVTTTATHSYSTLPSGRTVGTAGLMSAPRGRFGQINLQFPTATLFTPWLRDLSLWYWVPERDPDVMSKLALGGVEVSWGDEMAAFMGSLAALLALREVDVNTFLNSFAISGCDDQYLLGYVNDFRLQIQSGEPEKATRRRMLAGMQSNNNRALLDGESATLGPSGGCMRFLVEQVAAYVTGIDPSPASTPLSATLTAPYSGLAGWQCSNVWIFPTTTSQNYAYVIPPPGVNGYGGLLGIPVLTAQTMIRNFILYLNPVCSIIHPNNSTWNVYFS